MRKGIGLRSGTFLATPRGMTLTEARVGRFLRAPDGHEGGGDAGGGGDSGQSQNNGAGNNQGQSQSNQNQNNDGQNFDYGQFWNSKPEGNNQGDNKDGSKPDDSGAQIGEQLLQRITDYKPAEVFTQDALEKMREGDLSGLNTAFTQATQHSMRQMLGLSALMLQAFESSLDKRVQAAINGAVTNSQTSQKDEQLLSQNFAAFNRPEVRPVIHGVFTKALEHSGGDRQKALELTKGMLSMMGQLGHKDFGIDNPPSNPDDNLGEGPGRLVAELLSR